MFCTSCGAQIKDDAKFCGGCGTKVGASGVGDKAMPLTSIPLSPLPAGLSECSIKILSVNSEGADDDGNMSIQVKYEVTNSTDEEWEQLVVRTQLLGAAGQIIEETTNTEEQSISTGERVELESGFWGVNAKALGEHFEKAHIVLSAIASRLSVQQLGQIAVPETPYELVALKPCKVGDALQLVSGSLWKTEPDDDKDVRIEVKALVQNLTKYHLPEVKIMANITDKNGKEFADASGSDEVRPGNICVISGSGYDKDKKFKGSKAELAIRVYSPVASGIAQIQGIRLSERNETEESDDDAECNQSTEREVIAQNREGGSPLLINRIEQVYFVENISIEDLEHCDWRVDSACNGMHTLTFYETYNEDYEQYCVAALEIRPFGKDPRLIVLKEPTPLGEVEYPKNMHEMFGMSEHNFMYVFWGGLLDNAGELDDALAEGHKYITNSGSDVSFDIDLSDIKSPIENYPDDFMVVMRCVFNGHVEVSSSKELETFNTFDHEDSLELDDDLQMALCIYRDVNEQAELRKVRFEVNRLNLKFQDSQSLNTFVSKPKMRFEFDPSNSDTAGKGVVAASKWPLMFELDESNSVIDVLFHDEDECTADVDVEVTFALPIISDCDDDQFTDWAENQGGYFSCYVTVSEGDVDILSDEGQRLCIK